MAKSEHRIQAETLVAVTAQPDTMAWRNNTGTAWQGQKISRAPGAMVKVERGMVILLDARPISFGLEGSPDIIGSQLLDADRVRQLLARHGDALRIGQAFGLELKAQRGRLEDSQPRFARAWQRAGGLYGVPRSVEEALRVLRGE